MAALIDRSPHDRRYAALALTVLVHLLLLLGWQATRRLPALAVDKDTQRIQWIDLTRPLPAERRSAPPAQLPTQLPTQVRTPAPARETAPAASITLIPATPATPAATGQAAPAPSAATSAAPSTSAAPADTGPLVRHALRDAAAVDRALRKENNPYIVAPADSPEIRMRKGMEAAHEMAPPKPWEAPKMEELANVKGDGSRTTRVRGAFGTYCLSNKSAGMAAAQDPTSGGGKLDMKTCLKGQEPTTSQEWKTARDP